MKESELRIGNLIDYHGVTWSVEGIKNDVIYTNGAPFSLEIFQPIPLTSERLIILGFKKLNGRHGEYFQHNKAELFRVWYFETGWSIGRKDEELKDREYNTHWIKFGIQYVHQLQNIFFAITGEELTLKQ